MESAITTVRKSEVSSLLRNRAPSITLQFAAFAGSHWPTGGPISPQVLEDGVQHLISAFAAFTETLESTVESALDSAGAQQQRMSALVRAGELHAAQRLQHGYNIDDVIAEYRALRRSLLSIVLSAASPNHELMIDIVRLNDAIDQALAASSAWHSARISHARETITATLSNDLHAPLGAVRASAQYLLARSDLDSNCFDAAGRVLDGCSVIQPIIDDLLDFSRAGLAAVMPMHTRQVVLSEVCAKVVEDLRATHPDTTIEYSCPDQITGKWDELRLVQMIGELVANAVTHNLNDETVSVVLVPDNAGNAVLTVQNFKQTLDAESLPFIFDPVSKAPAAENAPRRGLFIANEIAVAQQGRIAVDSSEAHGTTFVVTLPVSW
jgi:signal transduction histidine kinase